MPRWLENLILRAPEGEGGSEASPAPAPESEASPAPEPRGSLIPEGETPADEAKSEGEAKPEGEGDAASKPKTEGEPASVLDVTKLTLPEGLTSDDPGLTKLIETLSNDKLTPNARAEALLTQHHDIVKEAALSTHKAMSDEYAKTVGEWAAEFRADPALGGDKFDATMATIAKGIDTWAPDPKAARAAFSLTGAGNNPHILRLIHTMSKALAEGGPAHGAVPAGRKTAAQVMYGDNAA